MLTSANKHFVTRLTGLAHCYLSIGLKITAWVKKKKRKHRLHKQIPPQRTSECKPFSPPPQKATSKTESSNFPRMPQRVLSQQELSSIEGAKILLIFFSSSAQKLLLPRGLLAHCRREISSSQPRLAITSLYEPNVFSICSQTLEGNSHIKCTAAWKEKESAPQAPSNLLITSNPCDLCPNWPPNTMLDKSEGFSILTLEHFPCA